MEPPRFSFSQPVDLPFFFYDKKKKKQNEEKNTHTHKRFFHGLVLGFSGDFSLRAFSPRRNDPPKKHTTFDTHQCRDNPPKFVYVHVFLSFPESKIFSVKIFRHFHQKAPICQFGAKLGVSKVQRRTICLHHRSSVVIAFKEGEVAQPQPTDLTTKWPQRAYTGFLEDSYKKWPQDRPETLQGKLGIEKIVRVSGVAPANQTKERSVHELFARAFRNKSSL